MTVWGVCHKHRLIQTTDTFLCPESQTHYIIVNLVLRTLVTCALPMTEYLSSENLTEKVYDLSKVLSKTQSTWPSSKLNPVSAKSKVAYSHHSTAGLKCRSQVRLQVTGHRSDHRPQVRLQVRSQVTQKQ